MVTGWALTLVAAAWALERAPISPASALGRFLHDESTHLVAHSILYGTLAALLASRWFPASALDGPRETLHRRAAGAALSFAFVAGAQETVQALHRDRLPGAEEHFDLAVDIAGASLGLIAWTALDPRRRYPVARALGVLLHPAILGPAGVYAVLRSALEDGALALRWTALAVACALPVAAVWRLGLLRGWYRDRDLSVREERPTFLAASLACAAALYGSAVALDAPSPMRHVALAGAVAAVLFAAVTAAGLKVSGHVAVPVGTVVLLHATSFRGPWPFALAALALSWARVKEGRHTPVEVLGAWGLAGASGALTRWAG